MSDLHITSSTKVDPILPTKPNVDVANAKADLGDKLDGLTVYLDAISHGIEKNQIFSDGTNVVAKNANALSYLKHEIEAGAYLINNIPIDNKEKQKLLEDLFNLKDAKEFSKFKNALDDAHQDLNQVLKSINRERKPSTSIDKDLWDSLKLLLSQNVLPGPASLPSEEKPNKKEIKKLENAMKASLGDSNIAQSIGLRRSGVSHFNTVMDSMQWALDTQCGYSATGFGSIERNESYSDDEKRKIISSFSTSIKNFKSSIEELKKGTKLLGISDQDFAKVTTAADNMLTKISEGLDKKGLDRDGLPIDQLVPLRDNLIEAVDNLCRNFN